MANTPTCPECDQVDRVIRLRSAYSGGITSQTSKSSGVAVTLTGNGLSPSFLGGRTAGVSQSDLSKRIAPFSIPVSRVNPLFRLAEIVLVVWLYSLLLKAFSGSLGRAWGEFMGSLLLLAFVIFIELRLGREARFKKTILMPWYEKYLRAWDSFYYCERCDVVFGIGSKKAVRPEDMDELLFEEVGEVPRYNDIKVELRDGSGPHRRT